MDSPAYLVSGIRQITQLSPTSDSVITLGQLSNVPLIASPSELVDGLEPHDHIPPAARAREHLRGSRGWDRGVPGVVAWVGTGRGSIPGTSPRTQPWPD